MKKDAYLDAFMPDGSMMVCTIGFIAYILYHNRVQEKEVTCTSVLGVPWLLWSSILGALRSEDKYQKEVTCTSVLGALVFHSGGAMVRR